MRCLFLASALAISALAPSAIAQSSALNPGGGSSIIQDFTLYNRIFSEDYTFISAGNFEPAQGDADFFVAELRFKWRFDGFFIDSETAPIVEISGFEPRLRLQFVDDQTAFEPEDDTVPPLVGAESVGNDDEPNVTRMIDEIDDGADVYRYIVPRAIAQSSQPITFKAIIQTIFVVDVEQIALEADYASFSIQTFEPVLTWVPYEPEACPADITGDGSVDLADLNIVLANFGQLTSDGDTDGNGEVNLTDLNVVLASFGTGCE